MTAALTDAAGNLRLHSVFFEVRGGCVCRIAREVEHEPPVFDTMTLTEQTNRDESMGETQSRSADAGPH